MTSDIHLVLHGDVVEQRIHQSFVVDGAIVGEVGGEVGHEPSQFGWKGRDYPRVVGRPLQDDGEGEQHGIEVALGGDGHPFEALILKPGLENFEHYFTRV